MNYQEEKTLNAWSNNIYHLFTEKSREDNYSIIIL